jgi:hypothetical protein
MNEKTKKLAKRIEKLKREFSMLPSLEERHSALEIEEYQHYLLELEETVIVLRYLLENPEKDITPPPTVEEPLEQPAQEIIEEIPETVVDSILEEETAEEAIDEVDQLEEPQEADVNIANETSDNAEEEELIEPIVETTMEEEIESTQHAEPLIETGTSVNDRIADEDNSLASKLAHSPISDLRSAFGLNERFFYANELFGGDGKEFVRALNELNHLESYEDAKRLVDSRYVKLFSWNEGDENVTAFMEIVERRYL